jgi:hypothetical protein
VLGFLATILALGLIFILLSSLWLVLGLVLVVVLGLAVIQAVLPRRFWPWRRREASAPRTKWDAEEPDAASGTRFRLQIDTLPPLPTPAPVIDVVDMSGQEAGESSHGNRRR